MKRIVLISALTLLAVSCSDFLDTRIDVFDTVERLETRPSTLSSFAYAFYTPMQYGFNVIDGNLFASASDEAEQTAPTSDVSAFNRGLISPDLNPIAYLYNNYYEGIRAAHFFLDYAKDGEKFLALNRDTSTVYNPDGTVYSTDPKYATEYGTIVRETYDNGAEILINYNSYDVIIVYEDETVTIGALSFVRR